ncbi:MAG: DNA primase, partial [Alphaproteobacteria bacterium]|nr:DNA primase [Alphaproteobacteria bacterium]
MKASELSHRLGLNAEAVCRYYLPNGRKAGRYWQVGNVQNEKGQSLFVRLAGPGVAGKWNDPAEAQHGDLLDIIQLSRGLPDLSSAMVEAANFLRLSPVPPPQSSNSKRKGKKSSNTDIAKRLYADSRPLAGTLGESYLGKRGIALREGMGALRFHPRAWFAANTYRPAIIVGVHNNAGKFTGINRMFLDKNANLIERRALGELNGNAARVGPI